MDAGAAARRRAKWTIAALSLGTTLNPLNSSMIAVALVSLQHDFDVSIVDITWVITVFYIASTVGQPLMGRVIDAFGPKRTFIVGMVLVGVAGAIAPAGGFVLVLVARVLMAIGTSVAFPAGVALVAPMATISGISPPRLLARIQIANTTAAAMGPVIGGLLVTLAGWPAIFLINVPLAAAALISVAILAPHDAPRAATPAKIIAVLDPVGVVAFGVAAVTLLTVALGSAGDALGLFLVVGVLGAALFLWRERRAKLPFIDVRMLATNRVLMWSYAGFTLFSILYYLALFGLPQLLEVRGGYPTAVVGVLMLPLSGLTIAAAPFVARSIDKRGLVPVVVASAAGLLVAAFALGIGVVTTAPVWMLLMAAVMGVPYCMGSLAMTEAVRRSAPPDAVGVASGLLQSTRYLGAIMATVVLGRMLAGGVDAAAWGGVVIAAVLVGIVHFGVALLEASSLRRAQR